MLYKIRAWLIKKNLNKLYCEPGWPWFPFVVIIDLLLDVQEWFEREWYLLKKHFSR